MQKHATWWRYVGKWSEGSNSTNLNSSYNFTVKCIHKIYHRFVIRVIFPTRYTTNLVISVSERR